MRRGRAATVALATLVHAGPALASIGPLRHRLLPGLSGIGLPDHLALTFDDGPDPESTPAFLDTLDRLGWSATFFMLGSMVRAAPSLAAEVVERGHEVALHGDYHRPHLLRTPSAVIDDVRRGLDSVAEATGHRPGWMRPPYGAISSGTLMAARRLELRVVLWSAWGRDWRAEADPHSVTADVEAGVGPGATVLLHDSDCTSAPGCWHSALGALPLLADRFAEAGLSVGPLRDHGMITRDGGAQPPSGQPT